MTDTQQQKQPCLKWSHPDWDGHLITGPNDHDIAEDYLGDNGDRSLLRSEPVEMTQEELDALPEFEG